jgi:hypothetical protein
VRVRDFDHQHTELEEFHEFPIRQLAIRFFFFFFFVDYSALKKRLK